MLQFFRDGRGATSIEYGAMVAVLGVAILLGGARLRDFIGGSLAQLTMAGDTVHVTSCAPGEKCPPTAAAGQGGSGVTSAR